MSLLALRHIANLWEVEPGPAQIADILQQYAASSAHSRDAGIPSSMLGFEFNIKTGLLHIPDSVRQHEAEDAVSQFANDIAVEDIDALSDTLQDLYPWIVRVSTGGRSGGWLIILPKNASMLYEFAADTRHSVYHDAPVEGMDYDYKYAGTVADALVDIAARVKSTVQEYRRNMADPVFWQENFQDFSREASDTLFDATPDTGDQPEDRTFVNALDDKKLRRTNPRRFDMRHDNYEGNGERIHDSEITNRYDNSPALVSSLRMASVVETDILDKIERLDWEIEHTVEASATAIVKQASLTIESATAEDMQALATMHGQAFSKYPTQPPNYFAQPLPRTSHDYFVARDLTTGKILGGFVSRRDASGRGRHYLVQILVSPEAQGQGIGKKLMDHFESMYGDATRVSLNTPDFATDNHRFYENLGYKRTPNPMQSGKTRLYTYEKDLTQKPDEEMQLQARLLQRFAFHKMWKGLKTWMHGPEQEKIAYKDFPPQVREFLEQKFGKVLKQHPEVREAVEKLFIEFMERPQHPQEFPDVKYRKSIAGEYFPEESKIGYYLPAKTLAKNWHGIVHEIVHALQVALAGKDSTIPEPPDKSKPEYYSDVKTYTEDAGEKHAYAVQDEFCRFLEEGDK